MQVNQQQLQNLEVGQTYQGQTITQIRQTEHNPQQTLAYELTLGELAADLDPDSYADPLDEAW